MSENNKSYRIRANVGAEENIKLNVNLVQDYDMFEILSLKIGTENIYKFHTADYGCVIGRVLANGGVGVPNAKLSIFIAQDSGTSEDNVLNYLYPYTSTSSKNEEGVRYNLLPEDKLGNCHQNVGTFPGKRMVLDDDNILEVYDKYYKYTTRTNSSGDFMLFGVPIGEQTLHMDVDLSDIGILSLHPRDMIYKGYNITQFENANMFKRDTNLDSLTQIISQDITVNVYPFWGEEDEGGEIKITREDIDVDFKFEPTCIFMGSIITDNKNNGVSKRCIPSKEMGEMKLLEAGEGSIEMIRKTPEGNIEEIVIQGNQLINGNGVWCYQIPMNLDYVYTDEYGNLVPTDDINKGIPTRTRVRFRISLNNFESDYSDNHLAKVLVPHNPKKYKDLDFSFGSATKDDNDGQLSFRDLFWNNVYTVKSYIPRVQSWTVVFNRDTRFTGIKNVSVTEDKNPIPYNNMRVNLSFKFRLQCFLFHLIIFVVGCYNRLISSIKDVLNGVGRPIKFLGKWSKGLTYAYIGGGVCEGLEEWYFAPNGWNNQGLNATLSEIISKETVIDIDADEDGEGSAIPEGGIHTNYSATTSDKESTEAKNAEDFGTKLCITKEITYFVQCVEISLAMENEVIQFDFYNDWINGLAFIPRWFATIRQKKSFLFGLIKVPEKIQACNSGLNVMRYLTQQCGMEYNRDSGKIISNNGCANDKWGTKVTSKEREVCHKSHGRKYAVIFKNTLGGGGFVNTAKTLKGQNVYYFKPCEWVSNIAGGNKDVKCNLFATDIVLLGSLNEENLQGIPQSFKKLSSTSYKLPPKMVATNLFSDSYLYGKNDGSICNEEVINNGVETIADYSTWVKNKTEEEEAEVDEIDYPITEYSGIDWSIPGPGQGVNDGSNLYYPGGHFLSISCAAAQVNVKSCVNLTRICEAGSMFSQRQMIKTSKEDGFYIMPNGIVAYDEINDGGFRSEFATLNFNGLKTKINIENGRREYDFLSSVPINFDGSFLNKIKNDGPYYSEATEGKGSTEHKIYRRLIETGSNDYRDFRFGITGERKYDKKYLILSGSNGSLPVYENSFYFYFGIKEGSTAFDELYRTYFAECPDLNIKVPGITIEVLSNATVCEPTRGAVRIYINNIENSINYYLFDLSKGGGAIRNGVSDSAYIDITGLTGNTTYEIRISNDEIVEISQEFFITQELPGAAEDISYNSENFEEEIYPFDEDKNTWKDEGEIDYSKVGYIYLSKEDGDISDAFSCIYIQNDNRYCILHNEINNTIEGTPIEAKKVGEEKNSTYVWEGNATYQIMGIPKCKSDEEENPILITSINVSMPASLDIILGNTFKVKKYSDTILSPHATIDNGWHNKVLDKDIKYEDRISLKAALRFTASAYDVRRPNGEILCKPNQTVTQGFIDYAAAGSTKQSYMSTNKTLTILNPSVTSAEYRGRIFNIFFPSINFPYKDFRDDQKVSVNEKEIQSSTNLSGYPIYVQAIKGEDKYPSIALPLQSVYAPVFVYCIISRTFVNINDYGNWNCDIAVMNMFDDGKKKDGKYYLPTSKICNTEISLSIDEDNHNNDVYKPITNDKDEKAYNVHHGSCSITPQNFKNGKVPVEIKEFGGYKQIATDIGPDSLNFIEEFGNGKDFNYKSYEKNGKSIRYFYVKENLSSEPFSTVGKLQSNLNAIVFSYKNNDVKREHRFWTNCIEEPLIIEPISDISLKYGAIPKVEECEGIIGVYDAWVNSYEQYKEEKEKEIFKCWKYVTKDTDKLAAIEYYPLEAFRNIVGGSDVYTVDLIFEWWNRYELDQRELISAEWEHTQNNISRRLKCFKITAKIDSSYIDGFMSEIEMGTSYEVEDEEYKLYNDSCTISGTDGYHPYEDEIIYGIADCHYNTKAGVTGKTIFWNEIKSKITLKFNENGEYVFYYAIDSEGYEYDKSKSCDSPEIPNEIYIKNIFNGKYQNENIKVVYRLKRGEDWRTKSSSLQKTSIYLCSESLEDVENEQYLQTLTLNNQ